MILSVAPILVVRLIAAGALRDASVGRWPAGHRPQKTHPASLAGTG
jgi:hypothetical protein